MSPLSRVSSFLSFPLFFATAGCGPAEHPSAASRDTYESFADLAAHQQEGRDFTVTITDRGAPSSAFAFHGGHIDTGTEKIAAAVAGSDWNSYVLLGRSYREHVTSAHFDDPRLVALARRSARCVGIHGHKGETPRICVGGANMAARAAVARSLEADGLPFEVLTHCEGLDGEAPSNPVNLCAKGVQLELSGAARDQLFGDPALLSSTARAIRAAMDALGGP